MKKNKMFGAIFIVSSLMILILNEVSAECCYAHTAIYRCGCGNEIWREEIKSGEISYDYGKNLCSSEICADGRPLRGTYCGQGSCNMFGCNCDDGCCKNDKGGDKEEAEKLFSQYYGVQLYNNTNVGLSLAPDVPKRMWGMKCN